MISSLLVSVLAFSAGLATAAPVATTCAGLWEAAPAVLSDLEVYVAQDYPAGTNFTYQSVAYNAPVVDTAAFCRFGAFIHTSNASKVQFEVWLPLASEWNGRFAMVGNGGDAGGVNFPDMQTPLTKYHFAVASTNAGHNGSSVDGSWVYNASEATIIDFGYRAVHLTAVYSKAVIKAYYGDEASYSYWSGCSSGGKQGLKEVQMYPEDFDGVLAGSPANWWSHLKGYAYYVNNILNNATGPGHLNTTHFATVGKLVMQQCDGLDGLVDGIITNSRICKPDLAPLSCSLSTANHSTCLTDTQIVNMYAMYADWSAAALPSPGTWLYSGYEPGSETSSSFSLLGAFPSVIQYFEYQILKGNDTASFSANTTYLEQLVVKADSLDIAQTNAIDPNITAFLNRGKLISFMGLADQLIPAANTLWYHEMVRRALGYPANLTDSFRLFEVPGMNHCGGGYSPANFGGVSQVPDALNGTAQSSTFDAQHDILLALMEWTEKGTAPDFIIGSSYIENDRRLGVDYQRKLCPYPQEGTYIGGDPKSADSFECKFNQAVSFQN